MPKKEKVWRLTIRKKLLLISLLMLLVPVSVLGAITYKVSSQETDALIKSNLRNSVRMAIDLAATFEEAEKAGIMSKDEAQEKVKSLLLGPKQDGVRPVNKHINLGANGYFYVLETDGMLAAHPSLEGQNIIDKQSPDGTYYVKDIIAHATSGGGYTMYSWPLPNSEKEGEKIAYSEQTPSWGWIIAAGSYMQDYNTGQSRILKTILITLVCCWVIGGAVMTLFALHISRPIIRLAQQARLFATGDLRKADLRVSNRDEIGELASSFEAMYNNLRAVVSGLLKNSDSLSEAAREVGMAIGETTQASNQIANSVQDMALSSETQERSIRESSVAMEEMAHGIQRIVTTSFSAYDSSAMTLEQAEQGNQLIVKSTNQMGSVTLTVNELAEIVAKLAERSQMIGEIIQVMTDLSSQTNLLALNASIEAARAGSEGRGFAVVASEVKKLAERSNESASQVSELIHAIQGDIEQASVAMQKGEREVAAGVESIENTGQAFVRILEATRSVVQQVQETSAAAEEMSASSQEISASLQEIERMSTRANELAQQISGATEEQIAAMEETNASSESLRGMAADMQSLAHRFTL